MKVTEWWDTTSFGAVTAKIPTLLSKQAISADHTRHFCWLGYHAYDVTDLTDYWFFKGEFRFSLREAEAAVIPFTFGNISNNADPTVPPFLPSGGSLPQLLFQDVRLTGAVKSATIPGWELPNIEADKVEFWSLAYLSSSTIQAVRGFRLWSFKP